MKQIKFMQLAKHASILLYVGKLSHDSPSQCHIALCVALKHVWHKDFALAFLALGQLGAFLWIGLQCAVNVFAFPSNLHDTWPFLELFLSLHTPFFCPFPLPTPFLQLPSQTKHSVVMRFHRLFFLEYWCPRLISQQKRCRPTICTSQFPCLFLGLFLLKISKCLQREGKQCRN